MFGTKSSATISRHNDLEFDPKPDITAYEVVLLLKNLNGPNLCESAIFDNSMPEELKRHWGPVDG